MLSKASPLDDSDPITEGFDDLEEETLPLWYRVSMFGLMILGLLWLVTYYIAGERIPFMASLETWQNFAIGFGLAVVGLLMTMNWR